jgi:hypothetical protein
MKTREIKVLEYDGGQIVFALVVEGFAGVLRISYRDNSRKNASYPERKAVGIYLDTSDKYTEMMRKQLHVSDSFMVSYCTDALLFAERHTQWLLEEAFRNIAKL